MNLGQGRGFENLASECKKKEHEREALDRNKRQEIKNKDEIKEEERRLQIFSEAIGDAEYYIGGGIGIELEEGAIKHKHGDIDIIVFDDELDKIKKNFEDKGFIVTPGRGWGGYTFDAMNYKLDDESDEPQDKNDVHIGIFVYKKDNDRGTVQQLEPDGSISKEFPLKYFVKDKQLLNYKENNLIIADLRLVVSLKMISERPKDIKDIERVKPLLKSKFSEQEIEELKDICKNNLKLRSAASLKYMFDRFLEKGAEIVGKNIFENFVTEVEKSKAGEMDESYFEAIMNFMEKLKDFSVINRDEAKNQFNEFVRNNIEIISIAQNNLVDKTLE